MTNILYCIVFIDFYIWTSQRTKDNEGHDFFRLIEISIPDSLARWDYGVPRISCCIGL